MKKNTLLRYISLLLFAFSTLFFIYTIIMHTTKSTVVTDTDNLRFKVIVYYPSWQEEQFEKIRFDIVTHVMYAFAIPTEEGNLLPLANEELAKKLIQKTHENNALILLSVGGWSYNNIPLDSTFMKATETPEKIQLLSDSIVNMCLNYGFDGIDLDWEYPKISNKGMQRYEALVQSLSMRLLDENKLLTAAVMNGVSPEGNVYPGAKAYTDEALSCFDFINIMAYDGGDGARHSSYNMAVSGISYWHVTRNIPNDKLVLGVPFYSDSRIPYEDILNYDPSTCYSDYIIYNGIPSYYNGISTITDKALYAVNNIGGIMVWEITQDTSEKEKSLLNAIGNVVKSNSVDTQ